MMEGYNEKPKSPALEAELPALDPEQRKDLRSLLGSLIGRERLRNGEEVESESVDLDRRNFIRGSAAALATTAVGLNPDSAEANVETSPRPQPRPETETKLTVEEVIENIDYEYETFADAVAAHLEHFKRDLPYILEKGKKITLGDKEERTRLRYLREALELPKVDVVVEETIRRFLPAKAAAESSLSADRESSAGALGILQFMPETWKEHARREDANILSLVEQVYATESLITQIDRTLQNKCADALFTIKEVFFAGDEESFNRDFYSLVIMNAFNAGAGTMSSVVNEFAKIFPDTTQVTQVLEKGILPYGHDVYKLMAHFGFKLKFHEEYGPESSNYVIKIFAAREVLDRYLTDEQKLALLGPEELKESSAT